MVRTVKQIEVHNRIMYHGTLLYNIFCKKLSLLLDINKYLMQYNMIEFLQNSKILFISVTITQIEFYSNIGLILNSIESME